MSTVLSMRKSIVLWLPIVSMGMAVVVNLMQFERINLETAHNYRALLDVERGDIVEVAVSRTGAGNNNVGPYYYFGRLFPGSEIVIPKKRMKVWFDIDAGMLTFGKAKRLLRATYDPASFLSDVDLSAHELKFSDYSRDLQLLPRTKPSRIRLFVSPNPSGRFIVLSPAGFNPNREGMLVLVDTNLIPEDRLKELGEIK